MGPVVVLALASGCPGAGVPDGVTASATDGASSTGTTWEFASNSSADTQTSLDDSTSDSGSDTGSPPTPEPWAEMVDDPHDVILGPVETVYEPPADFDFGSFPFATSVPRGDALPGTRVLVSFSESPDTSDATIVTRLLATTDLGESYATIDGGAAMENAGLLSDGTMLRVGFVPEWETGAHSASLTLSRSEDRGLSWSTELGSFDAAAQIRGLRFHRGLLEIPSGPNAGTVLTAFYALLGTDTTRTIGLAASHDGGTTWERWGTIAPPNDPVRTYDETTFEYASDGTLIAVTRAYEDGVLGPLLISRSDDDGQTFSPVEPVSIAFVGEEPAPRVGVDPGLLRMPNGAMLLVGGRLDNWIARSDDDGATWEQAQITYVNRPSRGLPAHGSSGYQALAAVSSHRAMLFGDNCANSWGCPESDSGWTVDGEYRIWRRLVDVVPSDPGRVDLVTAVARGTVAITTDLSAEDPALGALSLVDGSLATGSRLLGEGETVLEFDEVQRVTRIGIATPEGSSSAHVTIWNGSAWIDPLIHTSIGGERVLRTYIAQNTRPVQRIRIETEPQGGLSELEVFTTTNSFENEALDLPPRAASTSTLATVVQRDDSPSSQMVRLHDTADDAIATMEIPLAADTSGASFRVRALALPGSMLFGLAGDSGSVMHLSLNAQGVVRCYDPVRESWDAISPEGIVDPYGWFDLTLRLDGTIDVGETTIRTCASDARTGNRLYVSSTGTVPVGVDLLVDDVRVDLP